MRWPRPLAFPPLALAVLGLWGYTRWALGRLEELELVQVPRPGKVIPVQGVEIHYIEEGQGFPVLLIHGLGGSTYNFRHTIPALAREFRAIALDLPGFGLSQRPQDRRYSLSSLAGVVREFLDGLGIRQAHVVGHSMGGMVAARLAASFPERVDKLVLVASPVHLSFPRFLGFPFFSLLWEVGLGLVLAHRPIREGIWRNGFYDPRALTAADMEQYLLPSRIKGYSRSLLGLLMAASHDPPLDPSLITHPTLILWGEEDRPLTTVAEGRKLLQRLPNATLTVIPRACHMLLEERPEEANAAILTFLRRA